MIKSSDFLFIQLEKDLGYSIVQIFLTKDIDPSVYGGVVLVPYKYKSQTLDLEINNYLDLDYLASPIILHSLPRRKNRDKWINVKPNFEYPKEFELCDYKDCGIGNLLEQQRMLSIMTARTSMKGRLHLPTEKVIHLPVWGYFAPEIVSYYLTMEWIRQGGQKIEDFFANEEFMNNYSISIAYSLIVSTIPFNLISRNFNPFKVIP